MSNLDELRKVLQRPNPRYQPTQGKGVLGPIVVKRDGNREVIAATGPLDGAGEFDVSLKGHPAANDGEYLEVGFPADRPVGAELTYLGKAATNVPTGQHVDANFPAPVFAVVPWTTTIKALPGSVTAQGSVFFNAVEARFGPSEYIVSFRVNGGEWGDRKVPHIGGTQECNLGSDLPPGATVDVHLRAFFAWASASSPPTADSTFTAAADTSSPGSVTALTVSVATPGQLSVAPTATIDAALFRGYQYEIHTAPTGSPTITSAPIPGPWDAALPPGTYYVAARPVSKSGTLGTRLPSTGFTGPYVVADQSANLDTTPPAAIGAPTLASRTRQDGDNALHGYLTVTLPAYSFPADYAATEVSITVDDGRAFLVEIPGTGTTWDGEVGFGTYTVALRGRDQAGNRQGSYGSTAATTITRPAGPSGAPTVTTQTVGAGIVVAWTAVAGALKYEVQRATSNVGAGATTVATVDGLLYVDPLISDTVILPTYWYRVRAVGVFNSAVVNGTYSGWVSGTAGAVDGQNLRALSIVAGQIAANAITATKILAGSVTAAKLEADLILATMIRTATSGSRYEIEGHTGSGTQDQIRAYEFSTGADRLRWVLGYAGTSFYTDTGSIRALLTKDGVTVNRDSGAARMVLDGSGLYLYNDSAVLRTYFDKDGMVIGNDAAAGRVILQPRTSGGVLQILTDEVGLTLGSALAAVFTVGHASFGATPVAHIQPTGSIYVSATANQGSIAGEWYRLQNDGGIGFGVGGALDVTLRRSNDRFGNVDTLQLVSGSNKGRFVAGDIHSIRPTASNGIVWLGDGSGGDRYIFWNGTNYVMPGAQATINGVNVGSARSTKKGITAARIDLARAFRLAPSRFHFTEDADTDPLRLGFVAEDVRDAIPEASVDMAESLDPHGQPIFGGLGYSLEGLIAAQQAMIADLHRRLSALEGAV